MGMSIKSLPKSIKSLPKSMKSLPKSMKNLAKSMKSLPNSMKSLPKCMKSLKKSIHEDKCQDEDKSMEETMSLLKTEASGRRRRGRPRWMVDGVTGVSAVKNVVEDGRKEVAQILRLNMEELIVQKDMDLEIKKVATLRNALWMVDGVTGVSAVKNVVEDGRKEVAQILRLHMEELIV